MKPSTILTLSALGCQASARWFAYAPEPVIDLRGGDLSRPTQPAEVYEYQEYAPEPTAPPSKAVVDLLLHRRQRTGASSSSSDNIWEDDQTCGWYSGISSRAYDCQSPLTCSTNSEDVVACATDGLEQFYTVCLNYEAVQSSKCTSAGPQTGCCQNADEPACGTFVWTGTPARSMFKCFATATLISMLDEPQFVIDASRSSASASSSSAAAAAASRSSAEAASRSRDRPSTVVATTTAADGSTSTLTSVIGGQAGASAGAGAGSNNGNGDSDGSGSNGGADGGSSNNTGAIAGGVVGGTAFLALLALLMWYLMRKNNKFTLSICGGNRKTRKENNVDGRTYNKNNVKNDNRAYDERSYSNRNSYDNRAYDNRRSYDNQASNGLAGVYSQNSNTGAPQGPTNQHFHFHVDDNRKGLSSDSRAPVTQEPSPVYLAGAAAAAAGGGGETTAPAVSRREQRRLARQQRTQLDEVDLEKEALEQQAQEQQAPLEYSRSHRYHPSSGQRYPDAPPPAPKAQGPDLDFIGRGM